MLAGYGLVGFVVFALWLYCIYDVITTDESMVRNLPKGAWLMLVIFLFDIGALAWLLLGRPQSWRFNAPYYGTPHRSVGSDRASILDDPVFDNLSPAAREREERARLRVWEEQLRRREEDFRLKQLGSPPSKDPIDPQREGDPEAD